MANMYFAKININSDVHKLYENPKLLDDILKELILNINQKKTISLGENKKNKDNKESIKFITLEKDVIKRVVSGRLIKIYEDEIHGYDKTTDNLIDIPTDQLARSCTFFLDLNTEIVAFTLGKYIGHKQFCEFLEMLLDEYVDDVSFKVSLYIDKDPLKEQMKRFKRISKVKVSLILPNPNEEEFNKLFAGSKDSVKEINAHQYNQEFLASRKGEGLKGETKFLNTLVDGISSGYGEMDVAGIDEANEEIKVSSSKNFPYKRSIRNTEKQSIPSVKELGGRYIQAIIAKFSG